MRRSRRRVSPRAITSFQPPKSHDRRPAFSTAGPPHRRVRTKEALSAAREAAWKGESIERHFEGALDYAAAGGCSLVFLHGEYVGEIALDSTARARSLPRGSLHVYHEFNPHHRFYHISDPRRLAPGFPQDCGLFPSRDTAAVALLETLTAEGKLQRLENVYGSACTGVRPLVSFSTVSLAAPWFRVSFAEREFGWVMVDRKRAAKEGRWQYVGPPALEPHTRVGYFVSREEATLALLEAICTTFTEEPARFEERRDDSSGRPGWTLVAAALARANEAARAAGVGGGVRGLSRASVTVTRPGREARRDSAR